MNNQKELLQEAEEAIEEIIADLNEEGLPVFKIQVVNPFSDQPSVNLTLREKGGKVG